MKRLPRHAARKRRTRKQKLRTQARLLKYIERRLLTKPAPLDVSSVFGRTGAVVAMCGDYASSQAQSASETPYASYARAILQRAKAAESAMLLGYSDLHGD